MYALSADRTGSCRLDEERKFAVYVLHPAAAHDREYRELNQEVAYKPLCEAYLYLLCSFTDYCKGGIFYEKNKKTI